MNSIGSFTCDCSEGFYSIGKTCSNTSILVIHHTSWKWRPVVTVNLNGEQNEVDCFQPQPNTDAYLSCSIIWQNKLHVFGGHAVKRQISRLDGYQLHNIGALDFDFSFGSCGLMGNLLLLCMPLNGPKKCRRATQPTGNFMDIRDSNGEHQNIGTCSSESEFIRKV